MVRAPAPSPSPAAVDAPTVEIRTARPADRDAIVELGRRCSAETLRRRFHAPVPEFPKRYLDWILDPATHADNLVAIADDRVVALATFQPTGAGHGEIAVLVEDEWQHHGIGTRLVRRLGRRAYARHAEAIDASIMADNMTALALLRTSGADGTVRFVDGSLLVSVSLHPAG